MDSADLTGRNVVTGRDIESAAQSGVKEVTVRRGAVLTSTAREALARHGIKLNQDGSAAPLGPAAGRGNWRAERIFNSPEARAVKEEMVAVGRKLWQREYVDGNGGNISFRLSDDFVLCTPTLHSKGDVTPADICMVDMAGSQVAGTKKSTSEIKLHLEIFKHQPKAKACVHAHPVHATAYSIVGKVPPTCVIPEAEIFIGLVAFADYETPGTREMAEKVIPLCRDHNTILLANHGLICWADSATRAEWLVEVVDSYCRTLILANQLGAPITRISAQQSRELMETKKKLDLPDPRISGQEAMLCDLSDTTTSIIVEPRSIPSSPPGDAEVEEVVREITDRVLKALEGGEGSGK